MKIYVISVFDDQGKLVCQASDLSSINYFARRAALEIVTAISLEVVSKVSQPITITPDSKNENLPVRCHCVPGVVVATDEEYPARVAVELAFKVKGCTDNKELSSCLTHHQDPSAVDKITKIQKELGQTMDIMKQNIDQLMERGVKLSDLNEDSQRLSFRSKVFLREAEKMNSCCSLM